MKKALVTILACASLMTASVWRVVAADIPDRVVAVVGNEVVLKSEIDERELMAHSQYPETKRDPQLRKRLLENLIDQKILLTKAKLDSIKVDEGAIDATADERFASIRSGFSSLSDMEARFGKPASRLKQEIRQDLKDEQLIDNLRRKHLKDVSVTYDETLSFYKREKERLPEMPESVSVSQIVKFPVESESAKADAQKKIAEIQRRLKAGENFSTLASNYSDDPGSRSLGGDLGLIHKGELVPAFEKVAFALKPGQISGPVETRFGFHIIQVLEKEGNSIHVRHILAAFNQEQRDYAKTVELLGGIRSDVLSGKATFAEMAEKYSDDPLSSKMGGIIKASGSGETMFALTSLRPELQKIIAGLKHDGDISVPERITPQRGAPFIAIFRLNSRVGAHRLTPEHDFAKLQTLAGNEKKQQLFNAWVEQLKKEVMVRVMPQI